MADDFLSNSSEDREHDQAKLRRRKIRKNAAPVKKSMFPRLINTVITLVVFAVIGSFGIIFIAPEKVVNKWPQAMVLYEKVGIFVYPENFHPKPNIEIRPDATTMVAEGSIYKLTLSGHITNRGQHTVVLPQVFGTLLNASGEEIYKWVFCLPNRTLVRGQSVDYKNELMAAPDTTATAVVEIKWERDADGEVIDSCPPIIQ